MARPVVPSSVAIPVLTLITASVLGDGVPGSAATLTIIKQTPVSGSLASPLHPRTVSPGRIISLVVRVAPVLGSIVYKNGLVSPPDEWHEYNVCAFDVSVKDARKKLIAKKANAAEILFFIYFILYPLFLNFQHYNTISEIMMQYMFLI
jgi:hypothetical protein